MLYLLLDAMLMILSYIIGAAPNGKPQCQDHLRTGAQTHPEFNRYKNQNQFFRQIRNLVFDLTDMPASTSENDQDLVPTGIHWQVSQATTLENLVFKMPVGSSSKQTTHVGIFMENGSGGFVSGTYCTS